MRLGDFSIFKSTACTRNAFYLGMDLSQANHGGRTASFFVQGRQSLSLFGGYYLQCLGTSDR